MPIIGNVAYDPASSTLVVTTDFCRGDNRKWDSPLLPFIPYPTSCHSDRPLPSTPMKPLRLGQRLHLGIPMADPDTGIPVPTLAVTIHPQTGSVYPLGRLHVCPLTRLPQPIQIGYPMLDSRTGNLVLTVGVTLDPVTGDVLPVGGVMLAESFSEPLSGRMVRVGGASMRAGQVVPTTGGYQTLLDTKVLAEMLKILDHLRPLIEECTLDPTVPLPQLYPGIEKATSQQDCLGAATKELERAWGRSLHCQLQFQTRLETLLECAVGLQQDGGALGEMCVPGSGVCVPALLGMEYPDPLGSGLSVPVLGCHTDPVSGITMPLAGTMEDPGGKGMVAIRYGSQTIDPVTGLMATVVGIRLDVLKKTAVPVTAAYWLMMAEQTNSVQVEELQREVCARNTYWQQQKHREEEILIDLDSALFLCLCGVTDAGSCQFQWSGRQLREAAGELQDAAHTEAQRRAAQRSNLALVLPQHVLHILSLGDGEEWDQDCAWHSALMSCLDKIDICMEQLQQDLEKWMIQAGERSTKLQTMDREVCQRELLELCSSQQTDLDTALSLLQFVRQYSSLRAETAQAVLCGKFWFREYSLPLCRGHEPNLKPLNLFQQKALPLLVRLNQLLEEKKPNSSSPNTCNQHIPGSEAMPDSGFSTEQAYCLETPSRVWTASVPVVKGISNHSLRELVNVIQSQDGSLEASGLPTHKSLRHTASSGVHTQESQQTPESVQCTHIAIPTIPEEQWTKLVKLSPLFQLMKDIDLQLKDSARKAGFLEGGLLDVYIKSHQQSTAR
ncbi:uncharacterized protein si:dkey-103g5.4 [Oryzias melastigma]|uniref:uncharacterized protein si:dkey-103g5.4 n=1 Tax=Oryzias melastigma TaxID=30732 RepID=UPI00168D4C86|nr:uncharacterized protein si:dkey-103g5.4 [Oryzias melastigma]